MRNAALALGLIAGIIGIFVGMIGFGYATVTERHSELGEIFGVLEHPQFVQAMSFLAPMFAIAGGAMAKVRALWGGILLLLSGLGMYAAFGFNAGTMFPIGFAILGGLLAIAAGKPDEPKAHF